VSERVDRRESKFGFGGKVLSQNPNDAKIEMCARWAVRLKSAPKPENKNYCHFRPISGQASARNFNTSMLSSMSPRRQ
jgi:hypothetical protein